MRKLLVAIMLAVLPMAAPASAVTFTTNGSGQYTGVTGLNVNGTAYDVTFVDGSCNALFNNCTTFDFGVSGAADAADALFNAIESNADLNSNPNKTFGCSSTLLCDIFIPFAGLGGVDSFVVENGSGAVPDTVNLAIPPLGASDTSNDAFSLFARFSPTSITAVPEPSTWAMMLVGIGAIGFQMRRRRRTAGIQITA